MKQQKQKTQEQLVKAQLSDGTVIILTEPYEDCLMNLPDDVFNRLVEELERVLEQRNAS